MRLVWAVIPLVFFGIIGISDSFAEENSSIIYENDLEFSVITDKKYYSDDESIKIFWEIQNTGSDDFIYTETGCGSNFDLKIIDSELHRVNGILGESAKLIKENDPVILKFEDSGFYGNILQLIKEEPDKTRDILIFTSDGKKLVDILKEKFEVTKHSDFDVGPDSGGVRVAVKHIPEIASLDIVTMILGDVPVCTADIRTKILEPNQMINGTFTWSQLVHVKDNFPQHVSDGNYSILVNFYRISNCIVIGINTDDSQLKKIPCFGGIPSNVSKEQYIEYAKQQLKTIKHPELRAELIKELEILSAYSEYEYSQSEDTSSILSDADDDDSKPIKKILSPKHQVKYGMPENDVVCKDDLKLIFKSTDNSPACVTPSTAEKLIQRGWGVGPDNNKFQNLFEAKVTQIINSPFHKKMYTVLKHEQLSHILHFSQIGISVQQNLR